MKKMLFAALVAVTMGAGAVEFAECPKCDRWMRISEDGMSATVNLSRLKDDAPDAATSEVFATFRLEVTLTAGVHRIRLFNPSEWMPDVDRMVVR